MAKTNPSWHFGETIRKARLQAGMTQEQLGHAIGMSQTDVWKMESGRRPRVSAPVLGKIAKVTGFPVQFFYGEPIDETYVQTNKIEKMISELNFLRESSPDYEVDSSHVPLIEKITEAVIRGDFSACSSFCFPQEIGAKSKKLVAFRLPKGYEAFGLGKGDYLVAETTVKPREGDLVIVKKVKEDWEIARFAKQQDAEDIFARVIWHMRKL